MRNARKSIRNGQLLFALILVVALVAQPSGSFAQNQAGEQVIADGAYKGSMGVDGTFFRNSASPQGDPFKLLWRGKGEGDFTLRVTLGELFGSWELGGGGKVEADFSTDTGEFLVTGTQSSNSKGKITGLASRSASGLVLAENFIFSGGSEVMTTLYFEGILAELLDLAGKTYVTNEEVKFVVTELTSLTCHSFVGNWTRQIEESVEPAQFTSALHGTLFAVRTGTAFENQYVQMTRVENLIDRGLPLITSVLNGTLDHKALIKWASDANAVMFAIRRDVECGYIEDDAKYLTPIADMVYQMVEALMKCSPGCWQDTTLATVFSVAVGQAMLGPGWPESTRNSEALSKNIDGVLQDSFHNDVESGSMDSSGAKIYMDAAQATGSEGTKEAVSSWQGSQAGGN